RVQHHADEGTGCIKEQQMGLRFGSYPSTKLKNIELDFVFGSRFRLKLLTTESSTERTRNFVAVIALDSVFQQAASSRFCFEAVKVLVARLFWCPRSVWGENRPFGIAVNTSLYAPA